MTKKRRLGLSPHNWLDAFFDADSFLSINSRSDGDDVKHFGDEVIAGVGTVGGVPVAAYAHDPKVDRGFISVQGAEKICRLMDKALAHQTPIVCFLASPGISISEGILSGDAYTKVIARTISMSGAIPQIAVVIGVTMGAPAYSATLMDFILFNKVRSHLMVTSPNVVKDVLGEDTTLAELGGSEMHATKTGLVDFVDKNIEQQIERAKALIRLFPSKACDHARKIASRPPRHLLPKLPIYDNYAFEMSEVIGGLVDGSEFLRYKEGFGKSMICAFAYIDGNPVGILANNCKHLSGAIDTDAASKSARFIRLCDAYGVPILTLIDVPGFMPGSVEEQKGLLRHGAQFCSAMQTSVARISVVIRRCYGAAAYLMMQTASQEGDLVVAVKKSKIGIMGFEAARNVLFSDDERSEDELREFYFNHYESPTLALERGVIDKIIEYEDIRNVLTQHLIWSRRKQPVDMIKKKHSIIP